MAFLMLDFADEVSEAMVKWHATFSIYRRNGEEFCRHKYGNQHELKYLAHAALLTHDLNNGTKTSTDTLSRLNRKHAKTLFITAHGHK